MINLNEAHRGGTCCLSKAGLAIGDTTTGIKIAAPNGAGIDYAINGIVYHKADAATSNFTAAAVQPVLTTCLYLVCLDTSGNVSTVKGTAVLNADLAAGTAVLHWPAPAANTCPIGALKIVLTSSATFTAGTTALDAANVTETYYDLFTVPVSPLTA
jgi:hypothetical protein